eukprot:1929237-Lingulodinium_polyedra.AAC.1
MPDSVPCHSDQDGACIKMMHVSRVQCHEATEKPCFCLEKRPPVLGRKNRKEVGGRLCKGETWRKA